MGLWRGELSYRKIEVLLRHLPPQSAYVTAIREEMDPDLAEEITDQTDSMGPWSRSEMLLAQLIDSVNYLYYQQNCLNRPKNSPKPKPPVPVRRPGTESDQELFRKTQRYQDLHDTLALQKQERARAIAEQAKSKASSSNLQDIELD